MMNYEDLYVNLNFIQHTHLFLLKIQSQCRRIICRNIALAQRDWLEPRLAVALWVRMTACLNSPISELLLSSYTFFQWMDDDLCMYKS
jgi:hypothetical protein